MTTNINWKNWLLIFVIIYSLLFFKESMTNTKDFNTKYAGRFEVYLDGKFVHKKPKENEYNIKLLKQIEEEGFDVYKNIIKNSYKIDYNHAIRGFNVKSDSSYSSVYVDGYRLDKVNKETDKDILLKIKKSVKELLKDLDDNKEVLTGDWGLHNLIYSTEDNKIYNVDIEGFFTYKKKNKFIKRWMKKLDKILKIK
tara:strand:+ start:369 stop:956 length:588 start_codon:yes stop_codon:yes gene_type:complete